jgi:microcystin-dependent protein
LNTDASTKLYVDQAVSNIGNGNVPIGTVVMWCTGTIPTNWLLLDGSTYNTTTYATLFALLGSGTLPNMRGRAPRGYDSTRLIDKTVRNLLST